MKGKTTMTIVIGLVCVILTAVIFMQFKTISRIDVTALENMQRDELKSEIASWKAKYEEISKKLDNTNKKINEYRENISNNQKTSELLNEELKQANELVGYKEITGSGVVVTVANGDNNTVQEEDLLILINELRLAGAEAIAINDQRIVYDSYIVSIAGTYIQVNGERILSPYTVKAIGNPTYLESGLSAKDYGYIDTRKADGLNVTLERKDNIMIPKYEGNLEFEYEK